MHCAGCARSVEQYLRADPEVTDATVTYENGQGRGHISVQSDVEIEQFIDAIERMGYESTVISPE